MRFLIQKSLVVFSLLMFSNPCNALISVAKVSPQIAEDMGIDVISNPAGPGIARITIQFKKEGKLKDFNIEEGGHVELRVMEKGNPSILAPLHVKSLNSGYHSAKFSVARDQVSNVSIMIVVWSGLRTAVGYEIQLKEFTVLETTQPN